MEREFAQFLSTLQISTKNRDKLQVLTEVIFDLCWTNHHTKSEAHLNFVINAIADGLYKQGPLLWTGFISEAGQQAVDSGEIIRAQLCKEHPYPRKRQARRILNTFNDYTALGSSNGAIKVEIGGLVYEGCQLHRVLQEENRALIQFQKREDLTSEEQYFAAGIVLVKDIPREPERTYYYQGKSYKTQPEIVRDLKISRTTVQRLIKRGEISVERKEVD